MDLNMRQCDEDLMNDVSDNIMDTARDTRAAKENKPREILLGMATALGSMTALVMSACNNKENVIQDVLHQFFSAAQQTDKHHGFGLNIQYESAVEPTGEPPKSDNTKH